VDFVERWLHVSPDGGNGSVELVIYLTPILAATVARARWTWSR